MKKDFKKLFRISVVGIFFLFIALFGFYRSYNLIFGVKIKGVNLTDGAIHTGSVTEVSGNAANAKNLTLNGREISVDKDGNFNEKIALLSGYNIVTIKAVDKFGHVDEEDFRLIGESAKEAE